jgi:putative phosphoesterase
MPMVLEQGSAGPGIVTIGVLSDTHVPTQIKSLPLALIQQLSGVSLIVHAGDIVTLDVLTALHDIAEVHAVHGNADGPTVRVSLPDRLTLKVAGHTIGVIHGNRPRATEAEYTGPGDNYDSPAMVSFYRYLTRALPEADVIVFGHFHVPVIRTWEGRLLVNPGSVANKRAPTFALLHLGPNSVQSEIVSIHP